MFKSNKFIIQCKLKGMASQAENLAERKLTGDILWVKLLLLEPE